MQAAWYTEPKLNRWDAWPSCPPPSADLVPLAASVASRCAAGGFIVLETDKTRDVVTGEVTLPGEGQAAQIASNPYLEDTSKQRRVRKMTAALKRKVIKALSEGVSPTAAARTIGVSRTTLYDWRDKDQEFLAAWEEAREQSADMYEDRLHELAMGDRNPASVIFQLKNRRPEKWRDRHEVAVERSHHISISLPDGALPALQKLMQRSLPGAPDSPGLEALDRLLEPPQEGAGRRLLQDSGEEPARDAR